MGYTKKSLEGKYLEWYNVISANKNANPKIDAYSPVGGNVSSLDWQGEGKEAICSVVDSIDASCQTLYEAISRNIFKVNVCTGPILSSLIELKSACDEYNALVDAYYAALAELERYKRKKLEEM